MSIFILVHDQHFTNPTLPVTRNCITDLLITATPKLTQSTYLNFIHLHSNGLLPFPSFTQLPIPLVTTFWRAVCNVSNTNCFTGEVITKELLEMHDGNVVWYFCRQVDKYIVELTRTGSPTGSPSVDDIVLTWSLTPSVSNMQVKSHDTAPTWSSNISFNVTQSMEKDTTLPNLTLNPTMTSESSPLYSPTVPPTMAPSLRGIDIQEIDTDALHETLAPVFSVTVPSHAPETDTYTSTQPPENETLLLPQQSDHISPTAFPIHIRIPSPTPISDSARSRVNVKGLINGWVCLFLVLVLE